MFGPVGAYLKQQMFGPVGRDLEQAGNDLRNPLQYIQNQWRQRQQKQQEQPYGTPPFFGPQ